MKRTKLITLALGVMTMMARGDVLELKNGQVITGQYIGGTAGTIRFQNASGMQVIETSKTLALTFTGDGAPAAAAPTPAPAAPVTAGSAPAPAPSTVTINAGTGMLVRMVDGASSRDPRGKRFAASLELDLVVNGMTVAKTGSRVYGRVANAQQAGRIAGRSVLDLRLSELIVGGSLVPIMTGPYIEAGKSSLAKTASTTAAGAAIGGIADDAGKGAVIGASASMLRRGQTVGVAPGELLEFRLDRPVTITIAH